MSIPRKQYVVVTGAVAAGATTLAERLIEDWSAENILEGDIVDVNPFFLRAYSDFTRWGLASQLHFILASVDRHRILREQLGSSTAARVVIEDRTPFEHTGAYVEAYVAQGKIPADEAQLLKRATSELEASYVAPDLLIYRETSEVQLTERVLERNRQGEGDLPLEHYAAVHSAFEAFVASWDKSPIVRVPFDVDVRTAEGMAAVHGLISHVLPGFPLDKREEP